MKRSHLTLILIVNLVLIVTLSPTISAQTKAIPVSLAGETGVPTGKIAFIRDDNIWVMDVNGENQRIVNELLNADGRLNWSPDGRRIMNTRSGQVNIRTPKNDGGVHKVYDIFMTYLDSADVNNLFYWEPITSDLGSRDPEWSADGRSVVYTKDMFANTVNATGPNYQVCIMKPDGSENVILRKDWPNLTDLFITPTMNRNGDIAFVLFYDQRPQGIAVLNRDDFMVSLDTVRAIASKMSDRLGPKWSPDSKWLAYVNNKISDGGLYITGQDLKKHYLVHQPAGLSLSTRPPSWSPNSKWITFATTDGSIWITDITGETVKRLTIAQGDRSPSWSK